MKYKFATKRLLKKVVLSLLYFCFLVLFLYPGTANAQTGNLHCHYWPDDRRAVLCHGDAPA